MKEENQGTRYLYHSESTELYRTAYKSRTCPHSRNVPAFLDRDESRNSMKVFMNHLEGCDFCKKNVDQTLEVHAKLDEFIPNEKIPRDIQMEFENELSEMLKNVKLKTDPITKSKSILKSFVETLRFTVLGR
ncbi:MAG: hypothetical protein KC493_10320 [Bacteriovoracaceae bacterium]|nr:hypothetical protein [Bacteriovoracaceae bacterium]